MGFKRKGKIQMIIMHKIQMINKAICMSDVAQKATRILISLIHDYRLLNKYKK